jgi:hypothetical protein
MSGRNDSRVLAFLDYLAERIASETDAAMVQHLRRVAGNVRKLLTNS